MEPELYEREFIFQRARQITQADMRIAFLMTLVGITLMNLFG
jgi:hypothetical protein